MNSKSRNNNYLNIIFKILVLLTLYLLQQLPATVLTTAASAPSAFAQIKLSVPFIFLITACISIAIMFYLHQRTQKFTTKKLDWQSGIWIVGGAIFNYSINMLFLPLMKTSNNANVAAQNQLMKLFPVLFLIYAVIIAPISEEIFFRGYLINWFFADNLYLGAVVSAIIFGALHISQDPAYFLSKAILGLTMGIVYLKTKNIKANIILHVINNISAFFIG